MAQVNRPLLFLHVLLLHIRCLTAAVFFFFFFFPLQSAAESKQLVEQ